MSRRPDGFGVWSVSPPNADGWAEAEWIVGGPEPLERVRARIVDGQLRELHVLDSGESLTGRRLRALQVGSLELMLQAFVQLGSQQPAEPPAPLEQRERGYGADFYARVADKYRRALTEGPRPVKAIAEEAGVPRTTAARWVKEARRRGMLSETRTGRAKA